MLKIICVNGAPKTGKSTVSEMLRHKHLLNYTLNKPVEMKMAEPLHDIARKILGFSKQKYKIYREEWKDNDFTSSDLKVTLRQLLIAISENLIKPCMGEKWLATELNEKIRSKMSSLEVVIVDVGFQSEFDHFKRLVSDVAQVKLINLQREGCNYDNDSREDVSNGDDTIVIHNNGSLKELEQMLSVEMFDA